MAIIKSKQRTAMARTARINYLIDQQTMTAEEIVVAMRGKVNAGFVGRIMEKRLKIK